MYPLHKACTTAVYTTGTPSTKGALGAVHCCTRCPVRRQRGALTLCASRVCVRPRHLRLTKMCTHGGNGLHQCLCMYPLHKACPTAAYTTGTPSTKGAPGAVHYCTWSPVRCQRGALTPCASCVWAAHGTAARARSARTVVTGSITFSACTHCTKHAPLRHTPLAHPSQRGNYCSRSTCTLLHAMYRPAPVGALTLHYVRVHV